MTLPADLIWMKVEDLNNLGWRFHRIAQLDDGWVININRHGHHFENYAFGGKTLSEALRSAHSALTGEWASVPYEKIYALQWALARLTEALEDYHG